MAIEPTITRLPAPRPEEAGASARTAAAGFGASLERLIDAVETSNASANRAVDGMLQGKVDVHDAMIALQQAEMTLQLTMQVRNKLVQAYQDIMRMPV